MGTTLLLIDCQNDFVDEAEGTLTVPGASADMLNVIDLIHEHGDDIGRIVVMLDQHPLNHIAHACMWIDSDGQHPAVFTAISDKDVEAGVWRASSPPFDHIQRDYVKQIGDAGEVLTIWPEHCLIGTWGAAIYPPLMEELRAWSRPDREVMFFPKSGNWRTEQFSSLRAAVVVADDPSTDFNYRLCDAMIDDCVLVAGEASSHCVGATVMDAINWTRHIELATRMVLLTDCMSPVTGFEARADAFFDEFQKLGGRITVSTDIFEPETPE
jgi:nicotinamidase/pyrazinamidase